MSEQPPSPLEASASVTISNGGHTRRSFLGRLGALAAAVTAASVARGANFTQVESDPMGVMNRRRERAYKMRLMAANQVRRSSVVMPEPNTDEVLYPNRVGSYSKGLPHGEAGVVVSSAYEAMLKALATGKGADFAAIPMGGSLKLHSPQAAFSLAMQGDDIWGFSIPAAPTLASAETAAEMAEDYWMALVRDVPFADYGTDPLVARAAADLTAFSNYRGPRAGGNVTPATLFRASFPGVGVGPHISQFLLKPFQAGVVFNTQKNRYPVAGSDYATDYATWLALQRGTVLSPLPDYDPESRHIRCLRDIAEWVHADYPAQAGVHAALILRGLGPDFAAESNPYRHIGNQEGFVTFGPADLLATIGDAANDALRAAWYQKWLVHRRIRPEEFAGRLHHALSTATSMPVHEDLLGSDALAETFATHGSYLLPLAYPEGCPLHSAYPSGHATFIGAAVTVLKAYSNEAAILPDPVMASADGSTLIPYTGPPLTVGGELNKLASNVAMARVAAGVHWRTDGVAGMQLGEAVATGLLSERRVCYKEMFPGFKFTKFDGTPGYA